MTADQARDPKERICQCRFPQAASFAASAPKVAHRLGVAWVDVLGQRTSFILFDDGRATCAHVAAGAPSVSTGNGRLSSRRYRNEPFTIHRCADCNTKFAPKTQNLPL